MNSLIIKRVIDEAHYMLDTKQTIREIAKVFNVKKGEAYAQGVFIKYLTCGEEVENERTGGIGSTNKKEGNENE